MNESLIVFQICQLIINAILFYMFYRNSKEIDGLYTHVTRFTNYANELLDRITKLEEKKANHKD